MAPIIFIYIENVLTVSKKKFSYAVVNFPTRPKIPEVEKFLIASTKKFSYAVVNFPTRPKIPEVEKFLIASEKNSLAIQHLFLPYFLITHIYSAFQYRLQVGQVKRPAGFAPHVIIVHTLFIGWYFVLY